MDLAIDETLNHPFRVRLFWGLGYPADENLVILFVTTMTTIRFHSRSGLVASVTPVC